MKRALLLLGLLACASHEPPRTEVAIAPLSPPSAKPADSQPTDEQLLAIIAPDAGVAGLFGDSIDEEGGGGIGLGNVGGSSHGHVGPTTTGRPRIEPEIVQRVVRASFPRTRACYEKALQKTPTLTGRLVTRFVVDRDGNVSSASADPSSTITNKDTVDCVVAVFKALHFPKPEGGSVTIVYPLVFSPSD